MGGRSWCSLPSTAQMLNECKMSVSTLFVGEISSDNCIFHFSFASLFFFCPRNVAELCCMLLFGLVVSYIRKVGVSVT
jgi:hypothetical protein